MVLTHQGARGAILSRVDTNPSRGKQPSKKTLIYVLAVLALFLRIIGARRAKMWA